MTGDSKEKYSIQSPFPIHGFCMQGFTKCGLKLFIQKVPEISKDQNSNLPHAVNYLHIIYIVQGIISNLEMI